MQAGNGSIWSYYVNMFAISFFPAVCMHLSWLFPETSVIIRRWPMAPALLYFISALFWSFHVWTVQSITRPGLAPEVYAALSKDVVGSVHYIRIFALISTLSMVGFSAYAFVYSSSVIGRRRALVVLTGFALAFLPVAGGMILMTLISKLFITQNLFAFTVVLFPAAIGYAIAQHNLFDVDVYIKRTVGYVVMTSIVAGGYFAFQTIVKTAVLDPLLGESSEQVYPILFALLTVFAFNPVSQYVQALVDKLFYRRQYDYKATVASVSESLTSLLDIKTFYENVIQTVRGSLFIDRAGVIVLDERNQLTQSLFRGGRFGQDQADDHASDPCLSPNDPLLALLAQERKLVTKYDIAEDPRFSAIRDSCGQRFEEIGASLALPLYYRDQFAGILALGYKKSGHFYTREDIDLLKTLSTMTSTAIEQSREKGQKAVLMQLFSKHVSPQVAESLWEQREQFLEGGRPKSQSMIVTAMFTDLQGFSTLSEKQTPEVLIGWLNTYLEMMTTTVMEHGGVVDDFFGDGVKINFGVPIPRDTEDQIRTDAVNAVNCALAMEEKMVALNERMTAQGHQPLRMRVGVYTGPVVAGSLGSADRMKYTTIGDTVNTAARLESFDKDLVISRLGGSPCRILIGESTLRLVARAFNVEKVGELSLKGKDQKISAYCVLGRVVTASAETASV
jgi:class 3 adenylate cyclase